MPLFETACVAATAVFAVYKCFSHCIPSCNHDDGGRQYGRSYSASSTNYGSITTQPVYRPYPRPSPTDTRVSHARSKSTIKTPPKHDHGSKPSYPTRGHILQHQGPPSRLPVVPQYSAALADRAHCNRGVPADPTPALQSTSSGDPQAHGRPGEREAICRAPLASLTNLPDLESGEGKDIKGIATVEDLREQAKHRRCEMQKAFDLADGARSEGNHSARMGHKRDALEHKRAMEDLNKMAAEIIFKEKNMGQSEGTVDLHGLRVVEALEYAEQELQSATLRADRTVHFIVGKGKHSPSGAKIRPALEQLCDERGYAHSLDPENAGVLIVTVDDVDTKNPDRRIDS